MMRRRQPYSGQAAARASSSISEEMGLGCCLVEVLLGFRVVCGLDVGFGGRRSVCRRFAGLLSNAVTRGSNSRTKQP